MSMTIAPGARGIHPAPACRQQIATRGDRMGTLQLENRIDTPGQLLWSCRHEVACQSREKGLKKGCLVTALSRSSCSAGGHLLIGSGANADGQPSLCTDPPGKRLKYLKAKACICAQKQRQHLQARQTWNAWSPATTTVSAGEAEATVGLPAGCVQSLPCVTDQSMAWQQKAIIASHALTR